MCSNRLIFSGFVLLAFAPLCAQEALPAHITEAFEAYIALPDTLVPVLQSARDTESATAAAPQLLSELKKLYAIRESLQKVPSLTTRQNELVRGKYEEVMRKRWGAVYEEMFRLQQNRCYSSAEFARMYKIMCMMLNK